MNLLKVGDPVHEDQGRRLEIETDHTNQEVKTDLRVQGQDLEVNIDHNLVDPGPQVSLRCVGIVINQDILGDFAGQEIISKEIPNSGVETSETGDFKVLVAHTAPTPEIGRL